jgi:hypothetical protein
VWGLRDALLAHLSLLFVPVGVGVMTHLGVIVRLRPAPAAGAGAVDLDRAGRDRLVLRLLLRRHAAPRCREGRLMQDFVQLWVYLSATPLFGLTATVVTYVLAHHALPAAGPGALGQSGAVDGGGAGRCC